MFHIPMSSPMITTLLGGLAPRAGEAKKSIATPATPNCHRSRRRIARDLIAFSFDVAFEQEARRTEIVCTAREGRRERRAAVARFRDPSRNLARPQCEAGRSTWSFFSLDRSVL